ncbi:hypothetical protein QUA13_29025, partial [Microcoleus sp. S28C3]|uniref:hypothetical protein n=1 Tax=Microcoleus sp. S28C3 TaxID=3055414 RepID=UPI002FD656A9
MTTVTLGVVLSKMKAVLPPWVAKAKSGLPSSLMSPILTVDLLRNSQAIANLSSKKVHNYKYQQ